MGLPAAEKAVRARRELLIVLGHHPLISSLTGSPICIIFKGIMLDFDVIFFVSGNCKTCPQKNHQVEPSIQHFRKLQPVSRAWMKSQGEGFPGDEPRWCAEALAVEKPYWDGVSGPRGLHMGEPGVMLAFEETAEELVQNVRSLGFDLERLIKDKKLILDTIPIEATEFQESGEYDLEGLFVRLGDSIDAIGAKRIVLDTIEVLFGGLSNQGIIRSELRRLFQWLKNRNMTSIVTGERGEKSLTRQGLEEYVSDCVILLDHRVNEQMSTRRLRVVKYRGSMHGTNEFPFLIERQGLSVLPITSLKLEHKISMEKVSTGVPQLDEMFGGKGVYRGSTVLVTGGVGTGKSSLVSHFSEAACRQGEQVLYFAFEESSPQIIRNMKSIGLRLEKWMNKGLLHIEASRPTLFGLESHLVNFYKAVDTHNPKWWLWIRSTISYPSDHPVRLKPYFYGWWIF